MDKMLGVLISKTEVGGRGVCAKDEALHSIDTLMLLLDYT